MESQETIINPHASSRRTILDHQAVVEAYRRYARFYNVIYGASMEPGRQRALKRMNCRPGDKILEVGVGTGLSLPGYPCNTHITAIDLSPHMLQQAAKVVKKNGLKNVELKKMDAQNLQFPDNTYDKAAVMYVATVVPDPKAMMAELRRVCRTDSDVFVLNHFASRNAILRYGEKMLVPLAKWVGFDAHFDMDQFIEEAQMELLDIISVNAFGFWKLLHFRNRQPKT